MPSDAASPSLVRSVTGYALLAMCAPFAIVGYGLSAFGWAVGIWWAVANGAGFWAGLAAIFGAELVGFLAFWISVGLVAVARSILTAAEGEVHYAE